MSQQLQIDTLFANADSLFLVTERNKIECFTESSWGATSGSARSVAKARYESFRIQSFCDGSFKKISQFSKFVVFLTTSKQLFFYDRDTKSVQQPEPGLLFEAVCASKNRLLAVAPLYAQMIIMTSQIYGSATFDRIQRRVVQLSDYLPSVFAYQMKLVNSIVLVESFAQGVRPKRESAIRDIGEVRDAPVDSKGRLHPFEKSEVTLKFVESREHSREQQLAVTATKATPEASKRLHLTPTRPETNSHTSKRIDSSHVFIRDDARCDTPERNKQPPNTKRTTCDAVSASVSSERKRIDTERENRQNLFALGGSNLKSLYERLKKNSSKQKHNLDRSTTHRIPREVSVQQSTLEKTQERSQSIAVQDSLAVSQSLSVHIPSTVCQPHPHTDQQQSKLIVVNKRTRTQDESRIDPVEIVCAAAPPPRLTVSNVFSLQISGSPGVRISSQHSKDSKGSSVVLRSLELAPSRQKADEDFVFKSGPSLSGEAENKLTAMIKNIRGINEVISPVSSQKLPAADSPQPVIDGPTHRSIDEVGKCFEIGLDGSRDYRRPPSSPFEQIDISRRSSQQLARSLATETRSIDTGRQDKEIQVDGLSGYYPSADFPFHSTPVQMRQHEQKIHHSKVLQPRHQRLNDHVTKMPLGLFRTTPIYSSPPDQPLTSGRTNPKDAGSTTTGPSIEHRRESQLPPKHSRASSTHNTLPNSLNVSKHFSPLNTTTNKRIKPAEHKDATLSRPKQRSDRDSSHNREDSNHSRSRSRSKHSRSSSTNRTTESIFLEACMRLRHHLIAIPELQPHDPISFFASEPPNLLYTSTDSDAAATPQLSSVVDRLERILSRGRLLSVSTPNHRTQPRATHLSTALSLIKKYACEKTRHLKTAAIVCHTLQSKVIVARLRAAFDKITDESRERFIARMKSRLQEIKTTKLHTTPIDASKRIDVSRANHLIRKKSPDPPKKQTPTTNPISSTSVRTIPKPASHHRDQSRTCDKQTSAGRVQPPRQREAAKTDRSRDKSSKRSQLTVSKSQLSGCLKKPVAATTSCSLFDTPQRPATGRTERTASHRDASTDRDPRPRVRFGDC